MKPGDLHTQIFLDSGDPKETKKALLLLNFLDGQTTNPSLVVKTITQENSVITLTEDELLDTYKSIAQQIEALIPQGSISVEVYADLYTTKEQMIAQARTMYSWIPTAHIKLPTTVEGLKAAQELSKEGIRLNMTLVFSQEQAAAVYAATLGAEPGQVYVSPFIGRLDDRGENGMDLIKNIKTMLIKGDGHVLSLAASVRSYEHFLASIYYKADIVTGPLTIISEWKNNNLELPKDSYSYNPRGKKPIPYKELDILKPWDSFDVHHDLTDAGVEKFADDWKKLLR